jgi:hypothetical protein
MLSFFKYVYPLPEGSPEGGGDNSGSGSGGGGGEVTSATTLALRTALQDLSTQLRQHLVDKLKVAAVRAGGGDAALNSELSMAIEMAFQSAVPGVACTWWRTRMKAVLVAGTTFDVPAPRPSQAGAFKGLQYDFVLKALVKQVFFTMRANSEAVEARGEDSSAATASADAAAVAATAEAGAGAYEVQRRTAAARVAGAAAHYVASLQRRAAALTTNFQRMAE